MQWAKLETFVLEPLQQLLRCQRGIPGPLNLQVRDLKTSAQVDKRGHAVVQDVNYVVVEPVDGRTTNVCDGPSRFHSARTCKTRDLAILTDAGARVNLTLQGHAIARN